MRVVFFGTPDLAVPTLEAVAQRHAIAAVVCQPDKPRGRGKKLQPPPVKVWARLHGIPVHQPEKLNDGAFEAWLRDQAPDICVLVAYGRILKQPILDVPAHGFLNMHPSLLPRHRGPSPIQSALLEGDTETGVSIMRLDAGMDTGDVLLTESIPIEPEDTSATLSERLAHVGARLMVRALAEIEAGNAEFAPQDHGRATHTRMFSKDDARIDWSRSARDIPNQIRAFPPWPVACTLHGENLLRIHAAHVLDEPTDAPAGTVLEAHEDRLLVATGEGALALDIVQIPGKKAMPTVDFLRGYPVTPGDRLGSS